MKLTEHFVSTEFRGFERDTADLPKANDVRVDIVQRSSESKPVSMYQLNNSFVLCYSCKFASIAIETVSLTP